jgi:hypothetical protein
MMPNLKFTLPFVALALALSVLRAQSPESIVVQAASPAQSTIASPSTPTAQDSDSIQAAIKLLEQMKAANEQTLKKQEAALHQLDDMQQAAEQLKIFSKRG